MELLREAELDALMGRLARGDRSAFDPLYVALRPRAVRLARARLAAPRADGDADDVAQTALLKVFARASEFTAGKPCLPWFYAIVSNEIRAARRRSAREVIDPAAIDAVFAAAAAAAPDGGAEAELVAREVERALALAVAALDDDAADAIRSVLGDDATPRPRDVAPATLRKRVSRAYAKLRLLLGGHDAG